MKHATVHVVEYAPYAHRNERCAVGLLVRTSDGQWHAHAAKNLRKVRALNPSCDVQALRDGLDAIAHEINEQPDILALYQGAGVGTIRVSTGQGKIAYQDAEDLERGVQWALTTAAEPLQAQAPRERQAVSRLFVSVKQAFESYHWLAGPQQGLADHRIVVRYPLAAGEGVVVDFALQNGALHCLQTIDWRANVAQKRTEANAKLLALGMADSLSHQKTLRYAVLAGAELEEARPSVRLAERVCSDVFVHESSEDMRRLFDLLAEAMGQSPMPELSVS